MFDRLQLPPKEEMEVTPKMRLSRIGRRFQVGGPRPYRKCGVHTSIMDW